MNEIIKRFTSESPTFFKRIQAIGITLGSIGAALLVLPASVIVLPSTIVTMAGYFVAAGSVAAAVAKATVADPAVLQDTKPTLQVQSTVTPEK